MTSILQKRIQEYVNNQSHSVRELERQAGLQQTVIQQILNGKSKNPTIDTVMKIADSFNLSLDEMLGRTKYVHQSKVDNNKIIDVGLLESVCAIVIDFIKNNNAKNIKAQYAISSIENIYQYFANDTNAISDKEFARFTKWYLEQELNKN